MNLEKLPPTPADTTATPSRPSDAPASAGAGSLTLQTAIARHLTALSVGGYSPATVAQRAWSLGLFARFAEERGVQTVAELTPDLVARYQRQMFHQRKSDGQPLALRTQRARLVPLRTFGRWLEREGHGNPVKDLAMPRGGHYLPKTWLTAAEAEAVLAVPKVAGKRPVTALRDRALLETLYSTGLRRLEAIRLKAGDVDFAGGAVSVRQGKGRKDRVIPIGERALSWIAKYLAESRPQLARRAVQDGGEVFLTERGEPMTPKYLSQLVAQHIAASGIGKPGSCHLFRHTCATLMLEHGADIRHVQEQLGHASLATTQIYAQVSIRKLKEVHTKTHPAARLQARPTGEASA
jgi:integrase/recombinase XerD